MAPPLLQNVAPPSKAHLSASTAPEVEIHIAEPPHVPEPPEQAPTKSKSRTWSSPPIHMNRRHGLLESRKIL
eukprot:CAMPEP_0115334956 /NCGR_PEP_ID=MMETSP0270-20121206/88182_1 /TAXON_ID=71861 /ORGANISM="Scrippsiella trochoidea, Strain CCMP3099" /LENGTH=71 /DNA_ID=CAMNT_0002755963 /DNA_START=156 /DNA_END=368 /DNA_ORIENTATION=+